MALRGLRKSPIRILERLCIPDSLRAVKWPEQKTCATVLTFDLDAITGMASMDPDSIRRVGVMSSGAYGPLVGVPRILRVLKEFNIRATFFVPGYDAELFPEAVKSIFEDGHEIAHHGYMHKRPDALSAAAEEKELSLGIKALERITGA